MTDALEIPRPRCSQCSTILRRGNTTGFCSLHAPRSQLHGEVLDAFRETWQTKPRHKLPPATPVTELEAPMPSIMEQGKEEMKSTPGPETPEFIWEMRDSLQRLRSIWDKFPSGASNCSPLQYRHYNNVSAIIDLLRTNVEFANDSLKAKGVTP